MKRIDGNFPLLAVSLSIIVVAILAGWALSLKNRNDPVRPTTNTGYQQAMNQTSVSPSITQTTDDTGTTESFGSPNTWPYFNRGYNEIPKRDFRLRYPSLLKIDNLDSGPVAFEKNNEFYLTVEEDVPLTEFYIGDTLDEKFKAYYYYDKSEDYEDYPDLVFERINLNKNIFFYKVLLEDKRHYYILGEINGHGIKIIADSRLPEDILYRIIRSIEFK